MPSTNHVHACQFTVGFYFLIGVLLTSTALAEAISNPLCSANRAYHHTVTSFRSSTQQLSNNSTSNVLSEHEQYADDNQPQLANSYPQIAIDLIPMNTPVSTYALLDADGLAQIMQYARSQQNVFEQRQGQMKSGDLEQLIGRTHDPNFRKALEQESFAGAGLSQGDQFHLWLYTEKGTFEEIFGFLDDTPEEVQSFVRDLLAINERLESRPLADAYVRSEVIDEKRMSWLRNRGEAQFHLMTEFSGNVAKKLSKAVDAFGRFINVDRNEYEELNAKKTNGEELYLVHDGVGYQLTLYSVK